MPKRLMVLAACSSFAAASFAAPHLNGAPLPVNGAAVRSMIAADPFTYNSYLRMGQRLVLAAKIVNPYIDPRTITLHLSNPIFRVYTVGAPIDLPCTMKAPPTVLVPAMTEMTVYITFTGLPNYVCSGEVQYDLSISQELGSQTVNGESGRYHADAYIGPDDPVGKMKASPMPLEVVNIACFTARGATTQTEVAEKLTDGLFDGNVFTWDPLKKAHWTDSDNVFDLTGLLTALYVTHDPRPANSRDVSAFHCLLNQSLGVPATMLRMRAGSGALVVTNRVATIGKQRTVSTNFGETKLATHSVTLIDSLVYDASLALRKDQFNANVNAPAKGWDRFAYWQSHMPAGPWLGLVNRYAGSTEGEVVEPVFTEVAVKGYQ